MGMTLTLTLVLTCTLCRQQIGNSEATRQLIDLLGFENFALCPKCSTLVPEDERDKNYRRRARRWVRKTKGGQI
ncbi:MAG: hypothetical protein G01um101429_690 [Parcubacteria group bacterium Gr01-1014_29]|nr:MAG: hypothetical protein G01um101429_690 [Parcubacteria group bacterium Gr01-1014_29]